MVLGYFILAGQNRFGAANKKIKTTIFVNEHNSLFSINGYVLGNVVLFLLFLVKIVNNRLCVVPVYAHVDKQ
jgi:hypothetical protein